MKVMLAIGFPDKANELMKNCLKKQLNESLFEKLEIRSFPSDPSTPAWKTTAEDLIQNIHDAEILVVYQAPVNQKVIEAAADLKLIVCTRGGPVNIDIEAAENKGIPVSNAPGHNAEAVADHVFALLLSISKHVVRGHIAMEEGLWCGGKLPHDLYESMEMSGKTLGIVGFGNVGALIPKRAMGFGMKILVYDPYVSEERIKASGGEKVNFGTLLKDSDFITLHVRLTEENYHMFGRKQFDLMKPTAYLINASRGPAIDEAALSEALREHKIAGAALDVFEEEPIGPANPLLQLDNVVLTPHIAWVGFSHVRGLKMASEEIERFLKGQPLKYVVDSGPYKLERELYAKIFKGARV
jgi:D-3-phosphoglycerate dehydrogenase